MLAAAAILLLALAEVAPVAASPRADLAEAKALVRDGSLAEADEKLATLQTSHPDDPALLLMRGEVLLALGKSDAAVSPLVRALELDPKSQRGWFQLGNARQGTGDMAGALEAYARALETGEDVQIRTYAHLNRSVLFQKSRDWASAAAELEQVVDLDPARSDIHSDLASLYLEAGKLAEAESALVRGQEAGAGSAQLFYTLGARQHEKKAYEAAARAFERAIAIDPKMALAEKSLAGVLEGLGKKQEAAAHLRRYLELAPNAPDAATIKAHLKAQEGR